MSDVNIVENQPYVLIISSEKVKVTKNHHQTLLLGLSVVSDEAAGLQVWHNVMLVHADNPAQTANWLLRAGRELGQMLGLNIGALNPKKLADLRQQGLTGQAFEAYLKVEVSEEYGESVRLGNIIRHIPAAEISAQLGVDENVDFMDATGAYAGMTSGEVF